MFYVACSIIILCCVHTSQLLGLQCQLYWNMCRALKCHALSVTVTHFGLLSRSPATHCISHAEKLFVIYLICRNAQNSGRAALTVEPAGIKRVSSGVVRLVLLANQKIALLYLGKIYRNNQWHPVGSVSLLWAMVANISPQISVTQRRGLEKWLAKRFIWESVSKSGKNKCIL